MKISVEDRAQDLLDRFSVEAAVQDPCVRLSVQGVYRRSPQKIFVRDLKVGSLFKLCLKVGFLFKLSINNLRGKPLLSSLGTRSI